MTYAKKPSIRVSLPLIGEWGLLVPHRVIAPLLALAIGGSLAAAARAETGWYVSGAAGAYLRQDTTTSSVFTRDAAAPAAGEIKSAYDAGYSLRAAVGRRIGQHLRLAAELGYVAYSADHLNPFTTAPQFPRLDGRRFDHEQGAKYTRVSGALAGLYDFSPLVAGIAPYLGAGVGVSASRRSSGVFRSADGTTFNAAGGSGTEGFGFGEAGLSIPIAPNLTVAPAYRYVHYFRGDQDRAHEFSASLRYNF